MKAIILMAHGSRNDAANREITDLAAKLASLRAAELVANAFLDVLSPTLHEAIEGTIRNGADEIYVLPLFLNSGNHVTRDIPRMLEEARTRHSGVSLKLLQHIGAHPGYAALVADTAINAPRYVVKNESSP